MFKQLKTAVSDDASCCCVSDSKLAEVERGVQKLELTGKRTVQLRAGSEINLASAGKQNKRTSFRQSLAVCTERAQVGTVSGGFKVKITIHPLLVHVLTPISHWFHWSLL